MIGDSATWPPEYDSATTVSHGHASTARSRHDQHRHSKTIASTTRQRHRITIKSTTLLPAWLSELFVCFPTSSPTRMFIADHALGLGEYHSTWQLDLGSLLLTLPTSTRGERVVTTMLLDVSPNQLSHFLSYIFFWVNVSISIYFQLVNILL
jgi:hypothetical protein